MAEEVMAEPIGRKGASRGFLQDWVRMFQTLMRMFRDPEYRFPTRIKIMTALSAVYLVFPLDFLPDFIPLLGFADDFALLLGTFTFLVEEIRRYGRKSRR